MDLETEPLQNINDFLILRSMDLKTKPLQNINHVLGKILAPKNFR